MMPIADNHVPYSERMIQGMATSMGINVAQLWINPVTGALSLRDGANNALFDQQSGSHSQADVSQDET